MTDAKGLSGAFKGMSLKQIRRQESVHRVDDGDEGLELADQAVARAEGGVRGAEQRADGERGRREVAVERGELRGEGVASPVRMANAETEFARCSAKGGIAGVVLRNSLTAVAAVATRERNSLSKIENRSARNSTCTKFELRRPKMSDSIGVSAGQQ